MARFTPENRGWPSPQQEWLLRACLLRGQPAINAWQRWQEQTVFDDLDHQSQRLMPLLYRNLSAQGVRDPALERYKGFYRRTWYVNQLNRRVLVRVLNRLHAAGVLLLLLKGTVLLDHYYRDPGARPMDDIDVLVPAVQAEAAMARLADWGWQRVFDMDFQHSRDFHNGAGQGLDLHWHALHSCCRPGDDDDFWIGASAADFGGVPVLVLGKADLLLNVLEHGMLPSWGEGWVPPIRWVADAATVLSCNWSPADSQRLLDQIEQRQLFLPVRAALSYLERLLEEPLPERLRTAFNLPGAALADLVAWEAPPEGTAAPPVLRLWFDGDGSEPSQLVFLNSGSWPLPGMSKADALTTGVHDVAGSLLITSQCTR